MKNETTLFGDNEKSTPVSYSMPPYLQKAVSDMAEEFGMSKSALVAGLLEGVVMELREIKRNNPELLDLPDGESARRKVGASAAAVDHQFKVIDAALSRYRRR